MQNRRAKDKRIEKAHTDQHLRYLTIAGQVSQHIHGLAECILIFCVAVSELPQLPARLPLPRAATPPALPLPDPRQPPGPRPQPRPRQWAPVRAETCQDGEVNTLQRLLIILYLVTILKTWIRKVLKDSPRIYQLINESILVTKVCGR